MRPEKNLRSYDIISRAIFSISRTPDGTLKRIYLLVRSEEYTDGNVGDIRSLRVSGKI